MNDPETEDTRRKLNEAGATELPTLGPGERVEFMRVAPDADARLRLWQDGLARVPLAGDVDLPALAQTYAVDGLTMLNALRSALIVRLERGAPAVCQDDLIEGLRREMQR